MGRIGRVSAEIESGYVGMAANMRDGDGVLEKHPRKAFF